MSTIKHLRDFLKDGGYGPGERIPPRPELAEQLDVNLSAVERAVARLKEEGLVFTGYFGTYMALECADGVITLHCRDCRNRFSAPGRDPMKFRRMAADHGWAMRESGTVQFYCPQHADNARG